MRSERLHLIPRLKLPYSGRSALLSRIDSVLQNAFISLAIRKYSPDLVYASYPNQYSRWLRRSGVRIVYDCMDNYPEFVADKRLRETLIEKEGELIRCCERVFASSDFLRRQLLKRYGCPAEKLLLIRNGYEGELLGTEQKPISKRDPATEQNPENEGRVRSFAYIGTVSSWFDFEVLKLAAERLDRVEFHLIGPLETALPKLPGVFYDGVARHETLPDIVRDFDGLIMPFAVNGIVEAVDPVKLYEYINFNLPIVSVYYEEIERFGDYVWFYRNGDEFVQALECAMSKGKKYTQGQRLAFLPENSWKNRAAQIEAAIREG